MSDRADRIQRMREGRRGPDGEREDESEQTASATGEDETVETSERPDPTGATAGTASSSAAAAAASEAADVAAETDLDAEIAEALDDIDTSSAAETAASVVGEAKPATVAANAADAETVDAAAETVDEETVSVLEFVLGDERYCLDIAYIEQIVERGAVTRIPNAPPFVEGVIDLRGDITTVIDPTETLATDHEGDGDLIVVFDASRMDDEWTVGWAVDGVRRVSTVSLSDVRESPVDEPWINGVVKRADEDEFVIWTEPGELMRADGDEGRSADV